FGITCALNLTDTDFAGGRLVLLGQPPSYSGTVPLDSSALFPYTTLFRSDTTAAGGLPAGWSQWSTYGGAAFAVSSARSLSAPNGLAVASPTATVPGARRWPAAAQPTDVRANAAVYLDGPIPAQVLARGTG